MLSSYGRKAKPMAEMLLILLLTIFLTALSGFWLGYFLGKTITWKQVSDKLDTLTTDLIDQHGQVENEDIVKYLTSAIHEINVDKTKTYGYNDLNNQPKHRGSKWLTSEMELK